jgi:hypothetical protein
MRCRRLLLVALACLAACAGDPRPRDPLAAAHDGLGGWAVATLNDGNTIVGELIAIEPELYILARFRNHRPALVSRPRAAVRQLDVYAYSTGDASLGVWGLLGTVGTISNGIFLVFSAPVWIGSTILAVALEPRAALTRYPDHAWADLAKWARFPQGMPQGMITTEDLVGPLQRGP